MTPSRPTLIRTSGQTSESASSLCLYLLSWWVVGRPGRRPSRSGRGHAGPSGSRSARSPCRAPCGCRRPGCGPAASPTAAPARRSRTSADAPHTPLTGRHENFTTRYDGQKHFLNLLEFDFGKVGNEVTVCILKKAIGHLSKVILIGKFILC